MNKERKLTLQGKIDEFKSKLSFLERGTYGRAVSRSLFYFDQEVQNNFEDHWKVIVHFRKSKHETVGFVLKVPVVHIVDPGTGEVSHGTSQRNIARYSNTYILNATDILHLYNGNGKLVNRMTARDLAEMHEKISDEEIAEHERLRFTWSPPDY